jgi:HAD superfamily hydrolase (TIGR01509 family)
VSPFSTPVFSFDIGNTLLRSETGGGFCAHFSREVGIPFEELRPVFSECFLTRVITLEEAISMACGLIGFPDPDEVVRRYRPVAAHAFPDAKACLGRLRHAGVRIVALSNCTPWEASGLEELGLAHLLDEVVYSFQVGAVKPQAAIFEYVSAKLGVAPHEITHVGDSWSADVEGALRAGWTAVFLNRHDAGRDVLPAQDSVRVIQSLDEIQPTSRPRSSRQRGGSSGGKRLLD